jgi:hypothetical protein
VAATHMFCMERDTRHIHHMEHGVIARDRERERKMEGACGGGAGRAADRQLVRGCLLHLIKALALARAES